MDLLPVRIVHLATEPPPGALVDVLRGVGGDGPAAPFAGAVAADRFVSTRMNAFRRAVERFGESVPALDPGEIK